MGFFSFLGRVLFASLFILSAWQMFNDFGVDGGPAAKELIPKLAVAKKHISSLLGVAVPDIEIRHIVATAIFLKGIGGILFVIGNTFGAFLLLVYLVFTTPLLYDFYNYSPKDSEFDPLLNEFLQSVALFGALLFFIGMKNLIPRRQLKKKGPKAKTT
ncbi:HR-like lesion-inducing protein-related [Melia azedarach]|uniref:HR-like lesion-inducing protein-related n=2 Tax=Melia azedarach TaxID=155640 RepID=A0ACC1YHM9_MELAZ|nr:HR-like lesion-inducing protein-related [Melia azedarach]KAJ4722645.1 HR-like lesion-inducing protein-related [Melia azedarach]